MGFKVAVMLNGSPAGELEIDVKPEHVYDAVLQVGGSSVGAKVSYEQSELTLNLVAHLAAGGVLVDDILREKEQEKRDAIEGAVKTKVRPARKSTRKVKVTAKRVSSKKKKS